MRHKIFMAMLYLSCLAIFMAATCGTTPPPVETEKPAPVAALVKAAILQRMISANVRISEFVRQNEYLISMLGNRPEQEVILRHTTGDTIRSTPIISQVNRNLIVNEIKANLDSVGIQVLKVRTRVDSVRVR